MRVLQIVESMNMGGSQNFIMNVYRNICKDKIQFDFLTHREGIFDDEIRKLGGKIFQLDYLTKIGPVNYKKQLENFFKNHPEYDTIHVHLNQVSGIVLEVAKKQNIPNRIVHSHSTKNMNSFIVKIYKKYLQSKIDKNATLLLACGEEAAKWLYRDKSNEAIIINNGIDINKFRYSKEKSNKIRKELNINDKTIVIGHVGRFSKVKNHEFLIEVYRRYVEKRPDSLLIMVGIGELKNDIERLVKQYKLEKNVKFLGIRKDIDFIYSALDYVVFPSFYEGISLSLIEAQVSGIKIFASDTIDKNTDISQNIKWLSLKDSANDWAKCILDTDKARNEKNVKTEKYDIKIIANKLQELYYNLGEK